MAINLAPKEVISEKWHGAGGKCFQSAVEFGICLWSDKAAQKTGMQTNGGEKRVFWAEPLDRWREEPHSSCWRTEGESNPPPPDCHQPPSGWVFSPLESPFTSKQQGRHVLMEQRLTPAGIARPHPAAVWVVCECTRLCAQKSDPSLRKHLARLVHLFRVCKLHRNLIWHILQRQRVLVPGSADSTPRGVAGPAPPCSWMDLLPWRILCDAFCFRKWTCKGQNLYQGEATFIFPRFCVSCSPTLWGRGLQFWKMYFIWSTRKGLEPSAPTW